MAAATRNADRPMLGCAGGAWFVAGDVIYLVSVAQASGGVQMDGASHLRAITQIDDQVDGSLSFI